MTRFRAFALVAALVSACSAPRIAIEPRIGQPDVSGHVAAASPGQPLLSNDVEGALSLDQDDAALGLRADFEFGSPHLVLAWTRSENEGDGTLTGELSDDGVVLPVGTDVATNIDLGLFSGILTFDVLPTETFELGLGFGVHVVDLDGDVVSRDGGNPGTIQIETTLPIPVLALQAGVDLGRFEVSGLLSGMTFHADGDEATFYDFDVGARFQLFGDTLTGSIAAGWHYTRLDAEYEDEDDNADVDLRLSGPYLGFQIAF